MIDDNTSIVEAALDNWARCNRSGGIRLGYPTKSIGLHCGGASTVDTFDNTCDDLDLAAGDAMDTIIGDLSMPERSAIYHRWLGCRKMAEYENSLSDAYDKILLQINKKGLI